MWREWIDRIAKRIYVEKCTGCHSVDRRRMRWIDIVKDCLKKRGLGIRQARIIVHDRNVWRVCEGECTGRCPGDEPLTLTIYHSCELIATGI